MNATNSFDGQPPLARFLFTMLACCLFSGCAVVEPQVRAIMVNGQMLNEASGDVEIVRAGVTSAVTPGITLQDGDVIKTGPNANAILLLENGAVEVALMENTQVQISSLWVDAGELFVRVKRKLREVFEVESEYGVAAVEGTVFSVRVPPSASSPQPYECTTLEGRVSVRSPSNQWRSVRLDPGETVIVNRGSAPAERRISRREYNELVNRMNQVERVFRPGAAEFVAPDVVGLTLAAARREASNFGLRLGEPVPRVSGTVPVGQISSQNPTAGGRLQPRATIGIEIEVDPAIVPRVIGDKLATARQKLTSNNLRTGSVTNKPVLSGSFGTVIEQSEAPNARVVPDSSIDLVLAIRGVSVPGLIGTTDVQAKARLHNAGLAIRRLQRRQGNGEPGRVIEQDPASGDIVEAGATVDLVIERGCTVPDLVGRSKSEAYQSIRSAGLTPATRSVGTYNSDNVTRQQPTRNVAIRCGTTVQLDFGTNIG